VPAHPYSDDFDRLESHYSGLLRAHGDGPLAVQMRDRPTQERRFQMLTEVGTGPAASVLDFGCGTGHLLEYLRRERGFTGEYTGYDLSDDLLAAARLKFPGARFERRDIIADGIPEEFDYVFISGVFNNLTGHNAEFMRDALTRLFAHTRSALAFNALSAYVDYFDAGLYYADPGEVFAFCKERLSPLVTLRHDYLIKPTAPPYEFTVYVQRTSHAPRSKLT